MGAIWISWTHLRIQWEVILFLLGWFIVHSHRIDELQFEYCRNMQFRIDTLLDIFLAAKVFPPNCWILREIRRILRKWGIQLAFFFEISWKFNIQKCSFKNQEMAGLCITIIPKHSFFLHLVLLKSVRFSSPNMHIQ